MATAVTHLKDLQTEGASANTKFAFSVVTALFFIFGFITCLNDILIPHLKALFELDYARASLVQLCFFGAYFLISLPAGRLVKRFGYQGGAILGLVTTAVGCALFYPAASMKSYEVFLFGLFVLASGVTIIQVAVNPYIAILGPAEGSSARLNLAQAFNSLGTTLAPLFGSALILSTAVKSREELSLMTESELTLYKATEASSVQIPYIGLALVLLVLALILGLSKLPKFKAQGEEAPEGLFNFTGAWRSPRLMWGALGIFCYVGAEVAIGSYLINYLGLPQVWSMPEALAGKYVSLYWGGAMVGRFIGFAMMKKFKPSKILATNAIIAAILVLISLFTTGGIAAYAVVLVGLFNSIMFPTIFTLAIEDLGEQTPQGSAILCMAIVGGAVIPVFQGMLADRIGLHLSFALPVVCYLFIFYYGRIVSHLGHQKAH